MSFRVGDPIFTNIGQVGQVVDISPDTHKVKYDTDTASAKEAFRHGYIKGLSVEARSEFNDVMDEVSEMQDSRERVEFLKEKIERMSKELDPNKKRILSYLKAEMSHLMNTKNYHPRYFETEPGKLP